MNQGLKYSNIKPENLKVVKTIKKPAIFINEKPSIPTYDYIFFKPPDNEKARENGVQLPYEFGSERYYVWLGWGSYGIPDEVTTPIHPNLDLVKRHTNVREFVEPLASISEIGVNEVLESASKFVKGRIEYDKELFQEIQSKPEVRLTEELPDSSPNKQYYMKLWKIKNPIEYAEKILEGGRGICHYGGSAVRTLIGILDPGFYYLDTGARINDISHDVTTVFLEDSRWTVLNSLSNTLKFDLATKEQAKDFHLH